MFLPIKTIKKILIISKKNVGMFLRNKIIKNKKVELSAKKNVVPAHDLLNNLWFYYTWFRRALQMVLIPCAIPPK